MIAVLVTQARDWFCCTHCKVGLAHLSGAHKASLGMGSKVPGAIYPSAAVATRQGQVIAQIPRPERLPGNPVLVGQVLQGLFHILTKEDHRALEALDVSGIAWEADGLQHPGPVEHGLKLVL